MNATTIFTVMKYTGLTTREEIDNFFRLLAEDTLENQIAMTLTPDDAGTLYTTITGETIKVE